MKDYKNEKVKDSSLFVACGMQYYVRHSNLPVHQIKVKQYCNRFDGSLLILF